MKKETNFFKWLLFSRKGNITVWLSAVLLAAMPGLIINLAHFHLVGILPPCPLNTLFGIRCAGCGGTRCVQSMLSGNLLFALYYNPIVLLGTVSLAIYFGWFVFNSLKKNYTPPKYDLKTWQGIAIAAVLVGFMIIRNFDFYKHFFY
ncbi:MAG: DUF2752 domain-containing protein [Clostridia bacterium]|nr:DUF2752 domain-containing protein [Clostridia bacterium]